MSESASPQPPAPAREPVNWSRRLVVIGIVAVAVVLVGLMGAAYLPRWWALRVGDQVDQSTTLGVLVGLFYGTVFTFLPLMLLWIGFRRRRSVKAWLGFVAGALLLAAPNLLTLSVVVGNGDGAHAGERILDTEAAFFRASSLIGAIIGAAAAAFTIYVLERRRGLRGERDRLRDERRALDEARSDPERDGVA